jgi:hypothetical protein
MNRPAQTCALRLLATLGLLAATVGTAHADVPQLMDYQNTPPNLCRTFYTYNAPTRSCAPDATALGKATAEQCKAANLDPQAAPSTGCQQLATAPTPACRAVPHHSVRIEKINGTDVCRYTASIEASASGDYIGDYFVIGMVPPGSGLQAQAQYQVTKQEDGDDPILTMIRGEGECLSFFGRFKPADPPDPASHVTVNASELVEYNAGRRGWAWGLLTTPYKYYPNECEFQGSATIGPYFGFRWSRGGTGTTLAAAVTLGSVNADTIETVNGARTIKGETNVAALSVAVGVLFDFLKSNTGKPVTVGLLVGKDFVNRDENIDYRFNRDTWVAVQLGYDFTDN